VIQAETNGVPASDSSSQGPEQGDKTEATDFGDGIF
jgi:hypothetical protein